MVNGSLDGSSILSICSGQMMSSIKKAPLVSDDESTKLKCESKKMIKKCFPDQLRTVLGKHTDNGLDMLHEMLQNRMVLKSC